MPRIKQNLIVETDSASAVENPKAPFVQVLLEIIEDPRISAGAFRLYALLIGLSRGFGACWPSQATLATKLGITQRTVRNWLKELEAADYIEIEHRYALPGQEQSNIYHLKKLVPRQGERLRHENTTPSGTELPPPPAKICQTQRKEFSAYIHELDLHAKENINTQGKVKSELPGEPEKSVCDISGETENLNKQAKPDLEKETNEQLQADQTELTLIMVEQQLRQAGVSAKRLRHAAQQVVQNGHTARYVEGWINWIGRQNYIQNPAAYLLSRIQDNTDVPRPRAHVMPSRFSSSVRNVSSTHPDLAFEAAEIAEIPVEPPTVPIQLEEDVQHEVSSASRKLHLIMDNTRQKSPSAEATVDWTGLRLVVDNTTPPDELLPLELVMTQSGLLEPDLEDSVNPAASAFVAELPDTSTPNTTYPSTQTKSVDPRATTVDFRLKELMAQRDSRIRRIKRLEVIGETLYVAFWSGMDKESGIGPGWLADARFLYPAVTNIELL